MAENPPETQAHVRSASSPSNLTGQNVERYEVGECLGAGGMGEVYRAWDPLLKRAVALKRLAGPHLGDAQGREQLLREARALSSLSHPAIASVYDVVESHDELFIVEEFVPGTSLRGRMKAPVDLDTFSRIAEGCLSALDEAGRQGIVHCDIKPENIVLTEDGSPKILDFGLARRAAPETGETTVATRTMSVSSEVRGGTTSYMAPEALVQERADTKSDIWSLGVVFYELLSGRHPFRRDTATATVKSILTEQPGEPSSVRPDVPSRLDDVVMGMLVKEAGDRAGPAGELLAAVRGETTIPHAPAPRPRRRVPRLLVAAVLGVVLAAAVWGVRVLRSGGSAAGPVYLAVEPFENLAADPQVDAFALGFTEAVAELVGEVSRLYVIPADSVFFDVGATLTGEVQLAVGRLHVSYRVIDAQGDTRSGAVRGGLPELFTLRDRLAQNVSRVLANRFSLDALTVGEAATAPTNATAYTAYLYGRGHLGRAAPGEAVTSFEAAVAADPEFVPALIGLAEALWRASAAGQDEGLAARAREVAREAAEAAPTSVLVHRVRGSILLEAGEFDRAEEALSQALALDPADADASRLLARAQLALDRPEEADETLRRATRVAPDDWVLHRNLARHLFEMGKFAESAVALERAADLTPGNARYKSNLGAVYFHLGENEKAIDAYLESIAVEPNHRAFSNIATVYMAEDRLEEAAENLEAALALDGSDYRVWGNLLSVYEGLPGREDELAAALERALDLAEAQLAENPDDASALSLIGGYYVSAARPDDAIRAVDRALELAPDDMNVLFYCAGVFESLGERRRALQTARRALQAGFPLRMMEEDAKWRELVSSPEFRDMIESLQVLENEES